jgi:hypothetical protein
MEPTLQVTTPALLFPAISLLFLAYTNRFLALAQLIRQLHANYQSIGADIVVGGQIENLRKRIVLIKVMQAFGVIAFILCSASMFLLFHGRHLAGEYVFGASILSLLISLLVSLYEILISTKAIELELLDMENKNTADTE